jgi:hypothetical protein
MRGRQLAAEVRKTQSGYSNSVINDPRSREEAGGQTGSSPTDTGTRCFVRWHPMELAGIYYGGKGVPFGGQSASEFCPDKSDAMHVLRIIFTKYNTVCNLVGCKQGQLIYTPLLVRCCQQWCTLCSEGRFDASENSSVVTMNIVHVKATFLCSINWLRLIVLYRLSMQPQTRICALSGTVPLTLVARDLPTRFYRPRASKDFFSAQLYEPSGRLKQKDPTTETSGSLMCGMSNALRDVDGGV